MKNHSNIPTGLETMSNSLLNHQTIIALLSLMVFLVFILALFGFNYLH